MIRYYTIATTIMCHLILKRAVRSPRRVSSFSRTKLICFSSCFFSSSCLSYLVFHLFYEQRLRYSSALINVRICAFSNQIISPILVGRCFLHSIIQTSIYIVKSLLQICQCAPQVTQSPVTSPLKRFTNLLNNKSNQRATAMAAFHDRSQAIALR